MSEMKTLSKEEREGAHATFLRGLALPLAVAVLLDRYEAIVRDLEQRLSPLANSLEGCSWCDHDEAEGDLIDHCDSCCRKVTTAAYAALTTPESTDHE